MENSYGIGVANRYALFLDDDADPLEVLKVQEQEKELKKKTKVAEKENKIKTDVPPKTKPAQTGQRKPIKDSQNVKSLEKREGEVKKNGPPRNTEQRGERNVKFSGENREERNNRRNRDDKPSFNGATENTARFNRDDRPPRRNDNRGSGDNDNESGARGGRGGAAGRDNRDNRPRQPRGEGVRRNFENRGKREFDRQSGSDKTGVKPVDKRDGAGAHNWGSHKDEIDELTKPVIDPIDATWETVDKVEGTSSDGTEQKPGDTSNVSADTTTSGEPASSASVPQPPAEEEVKELTLDEWKAQKAAGRQKPQYNLRKAGEGEDLTQWKKMYALNKKKGEETDETDEDEYDVSEYPQRVGRQKHVLDIEVRFTDSRRGGLAGSRARGGPRGGPRGGDRGERGGDRGDRGERGGDRGERGGDRGDRGERGGDRGERGGDRGERGGDRGDRDRAGGERGTGERGGNKERKNFRNNPTDDQAPGAGGVEEPAGGRAEKGNPRQNARQSAPKVDDEHDFPSLG